jgi:hypothetical protein
VVGQVDPVIPELHPYATLWGEGHYIEGRDHLEAITFDRDFTDIQKGNVRIFDRNRAPTPKYSASGDLDPKEYGWVRAFGPTFQLSGGDVPVIDNGVCRVRWTDEGNFEIDTLVPKQHKYKEATEKFSVGHEKLLGARVEEWTRERGVVKASFASKTGRCDVHVSLQQGWEGPVFDIYSAGRPPKLTNDGEAHFESDGNRWQQVRFGSPSESLYHVQPRFLLTRR